MIPFAEMTVAEQADWISRSQNEQEALDDKHFRAQRRERLAGAILAGLIAGYDDSPRPEYDQGHVLPLVIAWADALIVALDKAENSAG